MTPSLEALTRKRIHHPTEASVTPLKTPRLASSSSSSSIPAPPAIDSQLVQLFLRIQPEPIDNPEGLPDRKLALRLMKRQTTYSVAIQCFNSNNHAFDATKNTVREIYLQACIALHQSSGSPKLFSHEGFNFIAYETKKPESKVSLFEWSGEMRKDSILHPYEMLGQGGFSITQKIKEIAKREFYALKCLRPEEILYEDFYSDLAGVCKEVAILQHIALYHGKIKSLPSPPLFTIPVQCHPTKPNVLFTGGRIEELYEGDLAKTSFKELSSFQKFLILNELVHVLHAIHFLNTKCNFRGSGVVHGDIKPDNILYRNRNENLELCLIDFGATASPRELYDKWLPECIYEDWMPCLYTPGFYSEEDHTSLKQHLKNQDFLQFEKLLLSMDVFAFGATLEFLLSKCYDIHRHLVIEGFESKFNQSLQHLIEEMLQEDPSKRLSSEEAADRFHSLVNS